MLLMKFSLIITCLIFFQSPVSSPSIRQIDSKASLTAAGGLVIVRTSTRCCRLIELTATTGRTIVFTMKGDAVWGRAYRETEVDMKRTSVNSRNVLFHLISSAEKLTIVGMKFSLMMMERICFQSVVLSPSSKQMDSRASFTAAGGLAIERTSTRCCFLMDLTAISIR